MKQTPIVLALALGIFAPCARATLLVYEPFDYPGVGGPASTNIPAHWTTSGGGKDDSYIEAGSLAVNGLALPVGNSMTNGGSGMSLRRLLGTTNSSGTLYFSIILRMNQLGTNMLGTNLICGFMASDDSTIGTEVLCRTNGAGFSLGLQKGSSGAVINDTNVFTDGQTVFLVGSYAFLSGGANTDGVALWINPNPGTFGAGSAPTPFLTTATGTDVTNIDRFNFRQSSTNSAPAAMQWDELRVATTWAEVTTNPPTSILASPSGMTVYPGSNVTFNVTATGSWPLSYQWRKNALNLTNGGNVFGATTPTLTLSNVLGADSGSYTVAVTGGVGPPTNSAPAVLSVIDPFILTKPVNQTLPPGSNALFSVTAGGTTPFAYQWQKNGINLTNGGNIFGVTNSTLTISAIGSADVATYTVVVTNSAGSTNADATLKLSDPAILVPPKGQTVNFSSNATFTVVVVGTTPFSYQWQKNGTNLTDGPNVTGSLTNILTLSNVAFADAGSYRVIVTNSVSPATSTAATLNVRDPFIFAQPADLAAANGANATFTVGAAGTAPLHYQWSRGTNVLVDNSQVAGSTNATLTLKNVSYSDATNGSYTVVVSGAGAPVTSSPADLTVDDPPAIGVQPVSQTNSAGDLVSFSVTASGGTLTYQWQFQTLPISGATKSTLLLTNVQAADVGAYSVVITNVAGSITSSNALLTVIGTNATQLALWDFNSNPPDTNTATGVTTPSVGSGTAAVVGGLPSAFNQGADADPASLGSDNSSWDITKGPPQGTGNKTAGVQFDISTADYTNIVIAWEQRVSALASKYYRFQYTTNGSAFIDGPVISMQDTNLFLFQTVDLSGVPGVADNTNFGFRVVAEFQSTAANTTNNNYVTTSTNAYATSGTMRFDMVNTFGDLIVRQPPVIHSLTGAGKGSITLTWGSISGLTYRVQYTFQLNPTAWTNLTPDITATNPVSFMLDNPGAASRRFYRVLLLQ